MFEGFETLWVPDPSLSRCRRHSCALVSSLLIGFSFRWSYSSIPDIALNESMGFGRVWGSDWIQEWVRGFATLWVPDPSLGRWKGLTCALVSSLFIGFSFSWRYSSVPDIV